MSLVPSAAFQNVEIKFNRGIDGENSVNETEDGFALDIVNADISLPHLAQKRGGYNVYGSQLPVRVEFYVSGYAQYERKEFETIAPIVTLNDGTLIASLGSEFASVDDSLNTAVVQLPGNTRLLTKNSLISIDGDFFCPVHIFNEEYILMSRRFRDYHVSSGSPIILCEGATNPVIDESQISTLTQTNSTTVVLTPAEGTILPLKVGASVMFETGLRKTGLVPVFGRVTAVTDIATTITLSVAFVGNVTTNYFRMRYINGQSLVLEGKDSFHFTVAPPDVLDVNRVTLALDTAPVADSFFPSFLYGTEIDVGAVTALSVYTTERLNELVTAYNGFVFREDDTRNNFTECNSFAGSRTAADQTISAVADTFTFNIANGIFSDSILKVQVGDTVYWRLAQNTSDNAETVEYEVTSATLTTVTVAAGGRTSLFVPEATQVHYIRTSAKIYISQTTATNYSLWVGRCVQPDSLSFQTAHYRIAHVIWPAIAGTSERSITLNESIAWSSETTFKLLQYFAPVWRPDTALDLNPIIALSEYGTTVDMPTELFDFSLYFATFNNGTWRYNGSQIISAKLPAPPTPLIRNVRGSGGTLQVVQGENNERVGRRYNFIVTYSYFETIDGVSRKIESGITPETDVSIVAQPALDGSLGSQKVELQVASIPRGIGLPAETMFINVYRTLEGIDESGVDGGQYLLERSIRNNPDRPFTSIIVGDVPEFDFNNANTDRLYTTIQSGATGALPNNATAPDCRYLVNFANRLLAVNCAKDSSLTFVCQKVFDTLTNAFKAHGRLDVFTEEVGAVTPYAQYVACPVGLATTSGSGIAFTDSLSGVTVNYHVASLATIAVTAVTYDDQAHIFTVFVTLTGAQNIVGLRYFDKKRPASFRDIDYEGQTFKQISSAAGLSTLRSLTQKLLNAGVSEVVPFLTFAGDAAKTGDVIAQPTATNGFFVQMPGLVKQDDVIAKAVAVQPIYLERDEANSTVLAANDFFVVQGLGTSLQILESANGRAYDLDREIVFQRVNSGTDRIQVKLFVISDSRLTYLETYYCNQIVTNQSGGAINPQFSILKLVSTVSGSGKSFTATPNFLNSSSTPPMTATITTAAHGIATVNANTFISIAGIGQIPENGGINYSGTFKVISVVSPTQLEIAITPTKKIWRSSLEGGSEGTKSGLSGTAVLPQVAFFVNTATSIKVNISPFTLGGTRNLVAGSYVFIYAAGVDANSHSLQLSGYFKTLAIYKASGGSTTGASPGDSVIAIEIETDIEAIDFGALSSLSNTRIVIMSQLGSFTAGNLGYIPVPVPLTTIDDVVSPMFSPSAADTTPLVKIIKRFALALNSTLGKLGFAYWGSAVTSNSEPFPANGFKFVARTIAATTFKLTSRRDTQIPGEVKSTYILEGATKIENVGDTYTSDTTGLLRELNPNRVYWTDAASIELSNTAPSFKDNTFFKDLPSADGEVLTGVKVFQNFLLLMKPNGIFRAQFNGNDLLVERVQSPIGTVAYKNIVDNEDGCYLVHSSGVYVTDGYAVNPVMKLKEPFRKFVQPNLSLLRETVGVNDNVYKEVILGIPYNEEGDATKADNQLVFNYFDNVKGWTRNTQFDARWWAKRTNRRYFAGNNGFVYVMRYEDGDTRYRDDTLAIPFRLKTAFLSTASKVTYKFFREMVLQFGAEAESTITTGYLTNYNRNEVTLETFVVEASGYGFDPYGVTAWGGDGDVKQIRRSVLPNRAQQVAFTIDNAVVDQNIQVYGVYVAAEMGSNTMTKQNNV